jgi:hypothetical protein
MEKPKGLHGRRRFWEQHLREWKSSGVTQAEYCRRHQLSTKTFLYWKRKGGATKVPVCLVEVPVSRQSPVSLPPCPSVLRLVVSSRYRIELDRDFDTRALDQLLGLLERR